MASRSASLDALLLRSKEVPSGARVVTLLSAEEGLIEAFVFGGGKSKLRSLASPWHYGRAWIYRDLSKGLIKLNDFDPLREHAGIRGNLGAISSASFVSEFMAATSGLGGDWSDALELSLVALASFEAAALHDDHQMLDRSLVLFILTALEAMGLLPDRNECSSCAGVIRRDALHSYSRRSGGFVCSHCAETDMMPVPPEAIVWLESAGRKSFGEAVIVGLAYEASAALKAIAIDLARKAADVPLRTLDSGLI
ncbi:MAG: DNA repair protein RecO [Spirochaetia bacterium]|jgi:DNA repair protein RecO|nr:DNA repair protein RecO [Spirochaetia bacterium]